MAGCRCGLASGALAAVEVNLVEGLLKLASVGGPRRFRCRCGVTAQTWTGLSPPMERVPEVGYSPDPRGLSKL